MSLVFTVVNSTAEKKKLIFLAPGAVRSIEELINYKPYYEFVKEIPKDSTIETTLAVYEYGEGEKYTATFEELAYLTIRMNNGVDFLKDHCKALGNPILPLVISKVVEKR
jgi:hypothetical protein